MLVDNNLVERTNERPRAAGVWPCFRPGTITNSYAGATTARSWC